MTDMVKFALVDNYAAAEKTAGLANMIWHQHYDSIIGSDQVDYMLASFQSTESIIRDIEEKGYEYFLIETDGLFVGYYAVCMDHDSKMLFLSKIYIDKNARGRGLSRKMLEHMINRNKPESIWLTVNKNNMNSIAAYEHMGFQTEKMQKVDIGSGYYMDDLVMRLRIDC